ISSGLLTIFQGTDCPDQGQGSHPKGNFGRGEQGTAIGGLQFRNPKGCSGNHIENRGFWAFYVLNRAGKHGLPGTNYLLSLRRGTTGIAKGITKPGREHGI